MRASETPEAPEFFLSAASARPSGSSFNIEAPELDLWSSVSESSFNIKETSRGATSKVGAPIAQKNWLNLLAYIVNTFVTYLSMTGIFGATNTEISQKYQTLVTPAGWAFSIWGIIFIWEGVFVVAQFFPTHRDSEIVSRISPWWCALCVCQSLWTLVFAQDWIALGLILMFSILASLSGISWTTDGLPMSTSEYFLLRAPFSVQLGWIIAASILNISVMADATKASQETLLSLAVLSIAAILAVVLAFTLAVKSPDPIVGLVGAWACLGIRSELANPVLLNNPSRFNPSTWDLITLGGLKNAALGVCILSAAMAAVATASRIFATHGSDTDFARKDSVRSW